MKRPVPRRRPLTLLLAIGCALVAVAMAGGCGGGAKEFDDPLAPFRDSVQKYLGPFESGARVKVYKQYGRNPQGYIKGGVVLVEADDKAISNFTTSLPESLRATTPDDVGTVVVIKQSWDKVGEYSGGEPAMTDVWKILVVDLTRGKVVGRAHLRGAHPPLMANIAAGENYGPPPWEELLAYLKKLPQR